MTSFSGTVNWSEMSNYADKKIQSSPFIRSKKSENNSIFDTILLNNYSGNIIANDTIDINSGNINTHIIALIITGLIILTSLTIIMPQIAAPILITFLLLLLLMLLAGIPDSGNLNNK